MSEQDQTTQVQEVNQDTVEVTETPVAEVPEEVVEKPLSEELIVPDKKVTKPVETVPYYKFKEINDKLKEAQDQLAKGQQIDVDDLDDLATKYDVSSDFINDLYKVVDKKTSQKYQARDAEIEQTQRQDAFDKTFQTSFDKSMGNLPEYSKVVNPEVIKTLSLDPKNQNKTMTQLIKDTYGNAISGRKPMESAKPGATRSEGDDLDLARAKSDTAYFSEIMKDPAKKKAYNENLARTIRL